MNHFRNRLQVVNNNDITNNSSELDQVMRFYNFKNQFDLPAFAKVHNMNQNPCFPVWDASQSLQQPNLILGGEYKDPKTIARVVYGVPKQYSQHHGFEWDMEDLTDQGFDENFATAVLETQSMHPIEASTKKINRMKAWAEKLDTGVQYVPAGLSPALNIAARQGDDWDEIEAAAKAITAAGDAVMINRNYENFGPEMVNSGKPAKLACAEHFQNGLKRPPNSWIIYRRDFHGHVLKYFPGMKNTDVSKVIAIMWKEEPEFIKQYYYKYAAEINRHFRENYPRYKFTPRRPGERKRRATRGTNTATTNDVVHVVSDNLGRVNQETHGTNSGELSTETSLSRSAVLATFDAQQMEDIRNLVLTDGHLEY